MKIWKALKFFISRKMVGGRYWLFGVTKLFRKDEAAPSSSNFLDVGESLTGPKVSTESQGCSAEEKREDVSPNQETSKESEGVQLALKDTPGSLFLGPHQLYLSPSP